jgi:hypothetical protein
LVFNGLMIGINLITIILKADILLFKIYTV